MENRCRLHDLTALQLYVGLNPFTRAKKSESIEPAPKLKHLFLISDLVHPQGFDETFERVLLRIPAGARGPKKFIDMEPLCISNIAKHPIPRLSYRTED